MNYRVATQKASYQKKNYKPKKRLKKGAFLIL